MEELNIQWYPGHMTRARRKMEECLKQVDAICEIVDARIPFSSRNPDLDGLAGSKPRMMILNRIDQADPEITKRWVTCFRAQGMAVLETDCKSGKGIRAFPQAVRLLLADKLADYAAKGQTGRKVRAMVAGIPNVGKSTFINRVAGRKIAAASDRPGVTRANQWINVDGTLDLLDTPGILWPKFDNQTVGENLTCTGAIRDEILDRVTLAANLMLRLRAMYPQRLTERYKFVPDAQADGYALLEAAAKKRGFLISGGEYDLERMSAILLDEFRGGKLGRVSLEKPGQN
jgi:ribosome biogenesis GTPase A